MRRMLDVDIPREKNKRAAKPKMEDACKKKGMVLYSAVSSPLDRSKRFTLSSPGRPVHSDTVLGFSWKHSSHAAIAQRLFTHISTTVYSQVLILLSQLRRREVKENAQTSKRLKRGFEPGLSRLRVRHSTTELPRSTREI